MKTLYQRAFRKHRLAVDEEMAMRETVAGLGVTCVDTDSRLVRRAGPVLIRPAKMI